MSGPPPASTRSPARPATRAPRRSCETYTEGVRGRVGRHGRHRRDAGPGPVRTEFLQAAGMDEEKFAAAFPKFLWMPSRDVARIGVDALEHDRGVVIAGLRNVLSTRLHASCFRGRCCCRRSRSNIRGYDETAAQSADPGQRRIQPSTGRASPLHSVQIVRYQPTATSSSIRCSSSRSSPSARHVGVRPRSGALQLVDGADQHAFGRRSTVASSASPVTSASQSSSLTPAIGPQNAA